MTFRRRIAAALLLAGAGLVFLAPGAGAHALLRSSDPSDGAELTSPPDAVTLTFTEDPEVALSVVRVLDSSGAEFQLAKPVRVSSDPRTIRVRVRDCPKASTPSRGASSRAWTATRPAELSRSAWACRRRTRRLTRSPLR